MVANKIVLNTENGEEILIDLTNDSVSPKTMVAGTTAHDASGNLIEGTLIDYPSLSEAVSLALSEAKESGAFDGKDGDPGKTPVKGTDYFTQQDIQDMVQAVKDALPSEKWDFELEDGTVVTKGVYVDA